MCEQRGSNARSGSLCKVACVSPAAASAAAAAAAACRGASRRLRIATVGVEVMVCAAGPAQPQPCLSYFSLVNMGEERGGSVNPGNC